MVIILAVIVGACILIAPAMIWLHTKETSKKLDIIIELIQNATKNLPPK